ncbi:MAG: cytochrome C peroxidase, partial [Minicystis sp.]
MRVVPWSVLLVVSALAGCQRSSSSLSSLSSVGEPGPAPRPAELASLPPAPAIPACARRSPGQGARPLPTSASSSAIALARVGDHLVAYVADEDERALRTVDVDAGLELSRVALGGRPSTVLLAPDGRIVVALRDRGSLRVFEPPADPAAEPAPLCEVETAAEPVSLAATPDGATLLVVSRWDHALALLDFATLRAQRTVDLPRDPQAVITSADGAKAIVSHLAGARLSVVDLQGEASAPHAVSTHLDERTNTVINFMPMMRPGGSSESSRGVLQRHERFGGQGYALVRLATGRILHPEVLVETGSGTGISSGYGSAISFPTVLSDISVVDAGAESIAVAPMRRAGGPTPCLLPRAAAIDERSGELLVTCLGIDSVIAYGASAKLPVQEERRRWIVAGGPTGVAVDPEGRRAVVFAQFESAIDVLTLGMPRLPGAPRVDL